MNRRGQKTDSINGIDQIMCQNERIGFFLSGCLISTRSNKNDLRSSGRQKGWPHAAAVLRAAVDAARVVEKLTQECATVHASVCLCGYQKYIGLLGCEYCSLMAGASDRFLRWALSHPSITHINTFLGL